MKRMLFNATHAEELRVAIADGQKLIDLDLEAAVRTEKKGNIYKGVITKVEPSLEACFVDYGSEKQGFLPLKEIYRGYFNNYDSGTRISDTRIDLVIREGQKMIVQVDKDERGKKGAALTTFISLAGRFLVLMPNNPKGGGISRRIAGEERNELREILPKLDISNQHSLIVRTEGIGRSLEELQWDLDFLATLWENIEQASSNAKAPFLIYQEGNLIVRSIRDHLSEDISEIIVDDEEIHERAKRFITQVMPHNLKKLKLYEDSVPLFSRYQIEGQIDSAFNRLVTLPSGGTLSVDHTEALISIDVNSARATKGLDIEETALNTNLEAVEEIARQLRIRDIGGLIVIDLIDMASNKNQRMVESKLKSVLKADRARVQVGHISRFGLLEMSRQRLRSSISDTNYRVCPRCDGMGTIRNVVSASLNLLRIIEDEALKENTEAIQVFLPLDMATYLLNEKRHELCQLETRLASRVILVPSTELDSPQFQIKRLRSNELDELTDTASFRQKPGLENQGSAAPGKPATEKPARPHIQLDQATPPRFEASAPTTEPTTEAESEPDKPGLLPRLIRSLFGKGESGEETALTEDTDRQGKSAPRRQTRNTRSDNRAREKNRSRSQGAGKGGDNQAKRSDRNDRSQRNRERQQPKGLRSKKPGIPPRSEPDNRRPGVNSQKQRNPQDSSRPGKSDSQPGTSLATDRKRPPRSKPHKPEFGASAPANAGRMRKRANQPDHPGPVITQGDIPADIPDDIGNRRD